MKFTDSKLLLKEFKKIHEQPKLLLIFSHIPHVYEPIIQNISQYYQKNFQDIETVHFNGTDTNVTFFYEELATQSMFSNEKLVIVKHFDQLSKHILQQNFTYTCFKDNLHHLPKSTYLILQLDEKNLHTKFQFLQKLGWEFHVPKLNENNLERYLIEKAKNLEHEVTLEAIHLLCEKCLWNLQQVNSTFDRLVLYTKKEKKITVKDINESCYELTGDFIFQIADLISIRQVKKAIKKLLVQHIIDGNLFSSFFYKLFSNSVRYYFYKKTHHPPREIHKYLSLSTSNMYIYKKNEQKFNNLLNFYTIQQLNQIIDYLIDLDKQIKTEPVVQHKMYLIMFFNKLCFI